MPIIPAIPAMIAAGGTVAGGLLSRQKPLPADPLLTRLAQQQAQQGTSLFNMGLPMLQQAGGYYGNLLGSRTAMRSALTPELTGLNESYRGAARGVAAGGLRGADRGLALADLNRARVGQTGTLMASVRPMAAANLMNLGGGATGQGVGATSSAGGMFGGLLGEQGVQNRFGRQQGYLENQDYGRLLFDIMSRINWGKGGGANPFTPALMASLSAMPPR